MRHFCRERGRSRPTSAWYYVEYEDGRRQRLVQAPKSYRNVKKVIFGVDGEGFVERMFRLWIEQPSRAGRRWLVQREARLVLDSLTTRLDLRNDLQVPEGVDEKVRKKLASYLSDAKQLHRRDFDRKVLETAREAMAKANEFYFVNRYGDSLENPPQ